MEAVALNYCLCEDCEFRRIIMKHLDRDSIERLCEARRERQFRKGTVINREGEQISEFKYLKSGLVKVFRQTSSGKEQIVTITRPFEFLSNINAFTGGKYSYSVSALEDSVICMVDPELMRRLFIENGPLLIDLLLAVTRMNEKIISQSLEIRNRNLAGKVAYVLLFFSDEIYRSRIFELPLSRREVADFIGMSTANVIRTLSEFRKEDIIKTDGKVIEIINREKLEMISKRG